MARSRRSNPLALATLCCLYEQPRHPYDVAATLRARQKHDSIRLNYGTLYRVVEALEADGFIEAHSTVRAGRRPERTVYDITPEGVEELTDWLSDLVAHPKQEFPQFEAALSLLPALPPTDVPALLELRQRDLDLAIARSDADRSVCADLGLPRLFTLEVEYRRSQLVAERAYVTALLDELRDGTFEGLAEWQRWHDAGSGAVWGDPTPHPAPGATTEAPTDESRPPEPSTPTRSRARRTAAADGEARPAATPDRPRRTTRTGTAST